MSSVGVTIAYIYTCVVAFKLFKWSDKSLAVHKNKHMPSVTAPFKKSLSLTGTLIGFVFLSLLLIPKSPAFMGIPSLIALSIWVGLGIIFYLIKGQKFRKIPREQLEYLILGKEPEDDVQTNKEVTG